MENNKKKFYDTTWFMWLTLIFFAPVGIFFMWRKQRFNKVVRIAFSGFFGLIFLFMLLPTTDSDQSSSNDSNENPVAVETQSSQEKEAAAQKEKEEQELKEKQTFTGDMNLKVDGDKVVLTINTNAPDEAIFEVSIINGNFDIQSEFIPVSEGKIVKDFTIPKDWGVGYIAGMAQLRFNLEDIVQPDHIKELYGETGEKMLGSLTQDNNLNGKNGVIETSTVAYPSEVAIEEAQTQGLLDALKELIKTSNGVILRVNPHFKDGDWSSVAVTVSDVWYNSPPHEKERFAEQIGELVKTVVSNSGKADKNRSVSVYFYDSYQKELATPKMLGGYNIKR